MNSRSSLLQTFLARFDQLKAAAGNNPNALLTFDQTTDEIRIARTLWRQRGNLVAEAGSAIQPMQTALIEMNMQLSHVLSDISGVSGMAIIGAILNGDAIPGSWPRWPSPA